MKNRLGSFRVTYNRIVCAGCGWPLLREYENGQRIEIKVSNYVISLDGLPKFIKCGRCSRVNTPEDMRENVKTAEPEEVEA